MRSITAAQTLAQRCLRRSTNAIVGPRGLLLAANTPPSLRPTYIYSDSLPLLSTLSGRRRCFSQTTVRPKKGGGKKDKKGGAVAAASSSSSKKVSSKEEHADEDDGPGGGGSHPVADPNEPFNFADVESRWQRSDAHHAEKFKELRRALSGGASDGDGGVDVDAIGQTLVTIKGEGSAAASAETLPLSQLALIIPRAGGRVVELRMHSPTSKKAIVSAVQANTALFRGQQPQPDPNDELVLLIKIGGAAAGDSAGGSSAAAAERTRRVNDLANAWRAQIRRATGRRQKTHQTWKKDGTVRPDDLHRLDRDLLKGQEKRMANIDAAEKEALRQLEKTNRR